MTADTGQKKFSWRQGRLRFVLFHATGLAVVLSPLAAVEVVVRLCVAVPAVDFEDPYVSFSGAQPLFVLDSTGKRFQTAADRVGTFARQSFAASKGGDTFRAFCLGGSTVQGRPYSVETSFTTWLELSLRAAAPERDFEVINCGGVSYASYRLVPMMAEILEHEPDLFIVYTGHNEFLEDRTYERIKKMPRTLMRVHAVLLKLRTYSLANGYLSGRRRSEAAPSKTILPAKFQTKLDFEDGLASYHRDPVWRDGIIAHFGRNIERMVRMARRANVPIILVNPVSNLKDCPPFKSEFGSDISAEQRRQALDLRRQAGELDWSDTYGKIGLLVEAAAIDYRHAEVSYLLGKCYERMGRFDEAKRWFVRAKEEDICPLRMVEPMQDAIADIGEEYRVPVVDAQALIEGRSGDGIAGDEWLLDHVHPSIAAHKLIAEAIHETMAGMKLAPGGEDSRARRDALWQSHLSSLDDLYFALGEVRLKRLNEWSGRIPIE